jgi:hypothetical protein
MNLILSLFIMSNSFCSLFMYAVLNCLHYQVAIERVIHARCRAVMLPAFLVLPMTQWPITPGMTPGDLPHPSFLPYSWLITFYCFLLYCCCCLSASCLSFCFYTEEVSLAGGYAKISFMLLLLLLLFLMFLLMMWLLLMMLILLMLLMLLMMLMYCYDFICYMI